MKKMNKEHISISITVLTILDSNEIAWLKAVNYFHKTLHLRCLTKF